MKLSSMKMIPIMILLSMLVLPMASALDFDNQKIIASPDNLTIEVVNGYNIWPFNNEISKLSLHSQYKHAQIQVGENQIFAEINFTNYEDYTQPFGEMEFYDLNRIDQATGEYVKISRPVTWRYSTIELNEVPDYSNSCSQVQESNGTYESCTPVQNGTKTIENKVWNSFSSSTVPAGNYNLGLSTYVLEGDHIEWIPNIQGVRVEEWADFSAFTMYEKNNQWVVTQGSGVASDNGAPYAQCFTQGISGTNTTMTLAGVEVWAWKVTGSGQPGTGGLWVSPAYVVSGVCTPGSAIGAINASVNWNDLTTSNNGQSLNVTLPATTINAGGTYAIVMNVTGTVAVGYVRWASEITINASSYRGGNTSSAVTIGNYTWADNGRLFRFKVYGTPPAPTESLTAINLSRPINYFNSSSLSVTFEVNVTSSNANFTAIQVNVYNQTNNLVLINATNLVTNGSASQSNSTTLLITLPYAGNYSWYANGTANNNTASIKVTSSVNYTFTIDQASPIVNITAPVQNQEFITFNNPFNVTINLSASDLGVGLSSCWLNNETANITIACGTNTSILFGPGTHNLTFFANDSVNNVNFTSVTFFINSVNRTFTYQTPVVEGENHSVVLEIRATNISSISANITYDNVNYTLANSYQNATYANFSRTLSASLVSSDTNVNITNLFIINSVLFNGTNQQQLVFNLPQLNVSTVCSPASLTFNLVDEETLLAVPGTFDYNFYYGLSNSSLVQSYGTITNVTQFSVCINTSISSNFTLGSGMIFYRNSSTYVDRRYYLFDGLTLTANATNITLYDLKSSSQTSFQLVVQDTSLTPYVQKFTTLVRWYPGLNQYNIVDMGLTDETGSTVIHVVAEDVDYRIGVYERNGTLINLADSIRMVCLVSPCTYTLSISPGDFDLTSFLNVQSSLTYNETTGVWRFIFSDPTSRTSLMNMTVYKMTGTSTISVCNSAVTGTSGAITCNTSGQTGQLKAIVMRSASPPVPIASKVVNIVTSAFKSTYGLWLTFLLGLPIVFIMALISPLGAIIGSILLLVPAFYLGTINLAILAGIGVLGGIVAHFVNEAGGAR